MSNLASLWAEAEQKEEPYSPSRPEPVSKPTSVEDLWAEFDTPEPTPIEAPAEPAPTPAIAPPTASYSERIASELQKSEGFRSKPYQDSGGVWTIGYGDTGSAIGPETPPITKEEARQRMMKRLDTEFLPPVLKTKAKEKFGDAGVLALLDLAYNAGPNAVFDRPLAKAIESGDKDKFREAYIKTRATVKGKPFEPLKVRRERSFDWAFGQEPAAGEPAIEEAPQVAEATGVERPLTNYQRRLQGLPPVSRTQTGEAGEETPDWNQFRNILESTGDFIGGVGEFLDPWERKITQGATELGEVFGGGLVWGDPDDPTKRTWFPRWVGAEEYARLRQHPDWKDYTVAQIVTDPAGNMDLGHVPAGTWEETKDAWVNGDLGDALGETGAYILDAGVQSVPWMVASVVSLPLMVTSLTGKIGTERAELKGKDRADIMDMLEAAPFAIGSGFLERIGAKGIAKAGRETVEKVGKEILEAGWKNVVKFAGKEAGKPMAKEAATEFFQEGVLEYVGARYGTDAQMSIKEMFDQGLGAAVVGGGVGGVGGGVSATGKLMTSPQEQPATTPEPEEDTGLPQPSTGKVTNNLDENVRPSLVAALAGQMKAGNADAVNAMLASMQAGYGAKEASAIQKEAAAQAGLEGETAATPETGLTPETTQAVGEAAAEGTTVTEPESTIAAQMDALQEKRKPAVLVPKGTPMPEVPEGYVWTELDEGNLIYREDNPKPLKQARKGKLGRALGYGIDAKPDPNEPMESVIATDAQGRVVQEVLTDRKNFDGVMRAARYAAGKGGNVQVKPPQEALNERVAEQQAEQQAPAPIAGPVPDLTQTQHGPVAQEGATAVNTLFAEDDKITGATRKEWNALRKTDPDLDTQHKERLKLFDSQLSALASQLDTLQDEGYDVEALRQAVFTGGIKGRTTKGGKYKESRHIGIDKAKQGEVLTSREVKASGKTRGNITNAVMDQIKGNIVEAYTAMLEKGPTGRVKAPGVPLAGKAKAKKKPKKKLEAIPAPKPKKEAAPAAPTAEQQAAFKAKEKAAEAMGEEIVEAAKKAQQSTAKVTTRRKRGQTPQAEAALAKAEAKAEARKKGKISLKREAPAQQEATPVVAKLVEKRAKPKPKPIPKPSHKPEPALRKEIGLKAAPAKKKKVPIKKPVVPEQKAAKEVPEWKKLNFSTPKAHRMVSDYGLDMKEIKGTGKGGRILQKDVENARDRRRWKEESDQFKAAMTRKAPKPKAAPKAPPTPKVEDTKAQLVEDYTKAVTAGELTLEEARAGIQSGRSVEDFLGEVREGLDEVHEALGDERKLFARAGVTRSKRKRRRMRLKKRPPEPTLPIEAGDFGYYWRPKVKPGDYERLTRRQAGGDIDIGLDAELWDADLDTELKRSIEAESIAAWEENAAVGLNALPRQTRYEVATGRAQAVALLDMQFNENGLTTLDRVVAALKQALHENDPLMAVLEAIDNANIGMNNVIVRVAPHERIMDEADPNALAYTTILSPSEGVRGIALSDVVLDELNSTSAIHVMVHEMVHAATSEAMTTDNELAAEMESLRKTAVAALSDADVKHYGLTNVDEFLAEALTNLSFQQELAKIDAGRGRSVWSRFVNAIRQALGMEVKDTSVLAHVLALSPDLMISEQEIMTTLRSGRPEYLSEYVAQQEAIDDMLARAEEEGWGNLLMMSPRERVEQTRAIRQDSELTRELYAKGGWRMGRAGNAMVNMSRGMRPRHAKHYTSRLAEKSLDAALPIMTLDNIVSHGEQDFEGAYADQKNADGKVVPTPGNPLKDYERATQLEQTEAKKLEQKADAVESRWRRWEQKNVKESEQLNDIILDSTMFQVDPSYDWNHKANERTRSSNRYKGAGQKAHARLRAAFKKLSPAAQQVYRDARDFYKETFDESRRQIIRNAVQMYGLDSIPNLERNIIAAKTRDELENMPVPMRMQNGAMVPVRGWGEITRRVGTLLDITNSNGPYFPEMRFGKYVYEYNKVTRKTGYSSKKAAMDAARNARADSAGAVTGQYEKGADGTWGFTITETGYAASDNRTEAEEEAADLAKQGFDVSSVQTRAEMKFGDDSAIGQVLAVANRKFDGPSAERNKQLMREALITMLPESSMQKRMQRRKNRKGANRNARRVFASYAQSAGRHLAKLKYRQQVDQAFTGVMNAAKTMARKHVSNDTAIKVGQIANEVQKRHNMVERQGMFANRAGKFGFLGYLASLSYSAVNATQPLLMTIPYLSGKHGSAKATAAMGRAYRMVSGTVKDTVVENRFGAKALAGPTTLNELVGNITSKVRRELGSGHAAMLQELVDRGILDATFALEISEASKGPQNRAWKMLDTVVEAGRVLPHSIEITNRVTTALAAFELARQDNPDMPLQDAIDVAHEAVVKTQFDYSMANRPRWFKANQLVKVMAMFKVHPLGVYSFMISNFRAALGKNATRQQKQEARRALRVFFTLHGLFGGAAGSILMEPIRAALGVVDLFFGDDEDPDEFLDDPELGLQNLVYDWTGSEDIAKLVTYGIPRYFGADFHTRVGLQNLMIQVKEGDTPWETAIGSIENTVLGPMYGGAQGFTRMFAHYQAGGSLMKSFEYAAPKGIRDMLRAVRYGTEGMTDFKGQVIAKPDQFTPLDLAIRAFGFGTDVESEVYQRRNVERRIKVGTIKRRRALLTRWTNAKMARDPEELRAIQQEIREFNEGLKNIDSAFYRKHRITRESNLRSFEARRKKARQMRGGIALEREERGIWRGPLRSLRE